MFLLCCCNDLLKENILSLLTPSHPVSAQPKSSEASLHDPPLHPADLYSWQGNLGSHIEGSGTVLENPFSCWAPWGMGLYPLISVSPLRCLAWGRRSPVTVQCSPATSASTKHKVAAQYLRQPLPGDRERKFTSPDYLEWSRPPINLAKSSQLAWLLTWDTDRLIWCF